jgi:hypothetical protein
VVVSGGGAEVVGGEVDGPVDDVELAGVEVDRAVVGVVDVDVDGAVVDVVSVTLVGKVVLPVDVVSVKLVGKVVFAGGVVVADVLVGTTPPPPPPPVPEVPGPTSLSPRSRSPFSWGSVTVSHTWLLVSREPQMS